MSNSRPSEDPTLIVRQLLRPMLAYNPVATAVGASLGIFAHTILSIAHSRGQLSWSPGAWYVWLLAAASIFNIPAAVRTVRLPDSVEVALSVIRRAKLDGVAQSHINAMYRQLFDRVANDVVSRPTTDVVPGPPAVSA